MRKSWWKNGMLLSESNFIHATEHGESKMYHDNGVLMSFRKYDHGILLDGSYPNYDSKGNQDGMMIVKDGNMIFED